MISLSQALVVCTVLSNTSSPVALMLFPLASNFLSRVMERPEFNASVSCNWAEACDPGDRAIADRGTDPGAHSAQRSPRTDGFTWTANNSPIAIPLLRPLDRAIEKPWCTLVELTTINANSFVMSYLVSRTPRWDPVDTSCYHLLEFLTLELQFERRPRAKGSSIPRTRTTQTPLPAKALDRVN